MPQRSNAFQELVTLIQEALAPKGAKVTASAMMPGPTSGKLREIDVLVEHPGGAQALKVAVEAKDESRKLPVGVVEEYIGKYFGPGALPVGEVVLVAHRGFTEEAKVRAKDVGIRLFTLAEAKKADWNRFFPSGLVPHGFVIEGGLIALDLNPTPALPSNVDKVRFFTEGRSVCSCCGRALSSATHAPLQQIAIAVQNLLAPWTSTFQNAHRAAVRNGGEVEFPVWLQPESVTAIRFEEIVHPIESVEVRMRCVYLADAVRVSTHTMSGDTDDTNVVHYVSERGPIGVKMLMPMGKSGSRGVIKHGANLSRLLGPTWLHALCVDPPSVKVGLPKPKIPTQEFFAMAPSPVSSEQAGMCGLEEGCGEALVGTFIV